MVLNRIGHTEAYTASEILVSGPAPTRMIASGISATDGIGRRNSMIDRVTARTSGMLPSSSPSGTAMTIESPSAMAHASTVATRSSRNIWSPSSWTNRSSTVLAGGTYSWATAPERLNSSQITRRTTPPATPLTVLRISPGSVLVGLDDHRSDVDVLVDVPQVLHQPGHALQPVDVRLGVELQQVD